MDRARKVRALWNWLPAFRAVAEAQHLGTAADSLHVSRSALSRSIALLEDELGEKLFDRGHRRLALNDAGERLLTAVRDAMRRVDDGMADIADTSPRGPVRIAAPPDLMQLIAGPVCGRLIETHPRLVPTCTTLASDPAPLLLRGIIDIAIDIEAGAPHADVELAFAAGLERGFYKWPGSDSPRTEQRFAASPSDGWPADVPRTIALLTDHLLSVRETARTLGLAMVLPHASASELGLEKLRGPRIPPQRLAVWRRPALGGTPHIDAVIEAIKSRLESLAS